MSASTEFYGFDDPDFSIHQEDMADYEFAIREKSALLNKLNVAELRVLLIHYKFADAREAKTWPKAEMIDVLAEHMAESE